MRYFSWKTQRDFFSLYFGVGNLAVSGTRFRVSFIVPVLVANAGAGQSKLLIPDSVLVSKSRYRSRLTYFISAIAGIKVRLLCDIGANTGAGFVILCWLTVGRSTAIS